MIDRNKLYIVEWVDSHTILNGWELISDIEEPKKVINVSVGFIIKETEDNIMIIPHIADIKNPNSFGSGCGEMVIPTIAIIKKTKLK